MKYVTICYISAITRLMVTLFILFIIIIIIIIAKNVKWILDLVEWSKNFMISKMILVLNCLIYLVV